MKNIAASLDRQYKGLKLLAFLLEKEFLLLTSSKPHEISRLQFSIQELLRQLVAERESVHFRLREIQPKAAMVRDILHTFPVTLRCLLEDLVQHIRQEEKTCRRLAARNTTIAQGLAEQTQSLLTFLHEQVSPRNQGTYTPGGSWKGYGSTNLFYGRL